LIRFVAVPVSGVKDTRRGSRRELLHCLMDTLTISLRHVASQRNQPCAVCAALFVPAEDSGSRVLSIKAPAQEAFGGLMCGGCYSKWVHGATVTFRPNAAR
jgi:hypothetical protein